MADSAVSNDGPQPEFLEIKKVQYTVILGYRIDPFWSEIRDIHLTHPRGKSSNKWVEPIHGAAVPTQPELELRPLPDEEPVVTVRPKADALLPRRRAGSDA